MQIEKYNSLVLSPSDMDSAAILDQLILLTEQYKRLNELLENKQNVLRQRALELKKRQLQTKCDMQRMWISLTQTEPELDEDDHDQPPGSDHSCENQDLILN